MGMMPGAGPADLMSLIGASQGGPPGGPGGMPPPDAYGPPPGPDPSQMGPDPSQMGPDAGAAQGGQGGNPLDLLRTAIDALSQYLTVEPDDIDSHAAAKVLAGLQAILAKNQKDQESATGVTPASRFLSRSMGG